MKPRVKFWIEKDGELVLSDWRILFLETIGETGSLSKTSEKLNIPYRRIWGKIHEIEHRLGLKLVEGHSGGAGGGGTTLTAEAKEFIQRYREFQRGLEDLVEARFSGAFTEQDNQ
jgi:molybdate transport system regulatory protein